MATRDELALAILNLKPIESQIRAIIGQIEALGKQLANVSRSRGDMELEQLLRKLNKDLHEEMAQLEDVYKAIAEDEEATRYDPNPTLIKQALSSVKLAKMQLTASRATLEGLLRQLKELHTQSIPKA